MKAIILSNGELQVKEIENSLETLQKIVGGYIEIPFLSKVLQQNNIDVIINDEGKFIEGLTPKMVITDTETKETLDIVYGNCIFVSHNDDGETIGLNNEQIKVIKEELKYNAILTSKEDEEKQYLVKVLFV